MKFYLDAEKMQDAAHAQEHIKDALPVPEYYGKNLDALYDYLTEVSALEVVLEGFDEPDVPAYARRVLRVCEDARMENPGLMIEVEHERR